MAMMMQRTPTPVMMPNPTVRETPAVPQTERPRSVSPQKPQAYPLIRSSTSPDPSLPLGISHASPPTAEPSTIPSTTGKPSTTVDASQGDTPVDPALLALDADLTSSVPPPAPPAQAVVPGGNTVRYPLTLHTALDSHRFTDPSVSTTSAGSLGQSSEQGLSQDTSPVTPSSEDQSGFASPVFLGGSEAGGEEGSEEGGVPAPRKKESHARKQPEGHIKRARNAFILFRKHITDSNLIPPTVEVKHQNISVVAAKMWREAPQDVRAKFQEMARIEKEEHQRKYPNYRYQPVFRRTDIVRRRVRKDGAEDEKVEAVAEALIKGKAGEKLEEEIRAQALVDENADISPENSAARSRSRRRRDPGQLSKGAIRAQKAQSRAKQMRANLLGHNLLNMSLYNAAQQQAEQQQRAQAQAQAQAHAAAVAQGAYYPPGGHGYGMEYMPVGYDMDGRPIMDPYASAEYGMHHHGHHHHQPPPPGYIPEYADEMYHIPPVGHYDERGYDAAGYYAHPQGMYGGYDSHLDMDYTLPPLLHQTDATPAVEAGDPLTLAPNSAGILPEMTQARGLHASVADEDERGEDPRMRGWGSRMTVPAEQQTPSGHVMFNEHLFDGALGAVGGKEDELGDFDDAVRQANEIW